MIFLNDILSAIPLGFFLSFMIGPVFFVLLEPSVVKGFRAAVMFDLGVVLAENKNAAQSVLEAFNGLRARVIVQEFIREAKGADIRAFVVDGEVVGAMKRQGKEGEFRSNLHRGGTAMQIELTEEEKDTAIRAAAAVGLGVAGVDMLQSARGPLVLEVNSSPGLEGIERATGVDIAGKIISYIEKNVG